MALIKELAQELKALLSGRVPLLDVILPPLIFTVLNGRVSLTASLAIAVTSSIILFGFRLIQGQPVGYSLGGTGLILLAGALAYLTNSAQSFFLPGVITSALTFLAAGVSLLIKRPLAAWSSHLTRGWPLAWYWHPHVRPAYAEVTFLWTLFFFFQFLIQGYFYFLGEAQTLGLVQLITGWPALVILLVASYVYGLWKLEKLAGPSVKEFQEGTPAPWEGQKRGF